MAAETGYWKCRVCGDILQTDADENDPPMCDDCIGYRNLDITMDPVAVIPQAEYEGLLRRAARDGGQG